MVVLLVMATRPLPVAATEPSPPVVRLSRDLLTVHVRAMPMKELLARLERESGATIRGTVPERTVTADLVEAPLPDALNGILGAQSFMLTYGSGGTLQAIELLDAGTVPAPTPAPPAEPGGNPSRRRRPLAEEEAQAAILQRRVAVSRALARAVGDERPPVG